MKKFYYLLALFFTFLILFESNTQALAKQKLILSSTTSTLDSGLFDVLIPAFEKKYDCKVKVIAVGTGQAIRLAQDGNADVILVHDRDAENKFVRNGYGIKRFDVMHNDFIIVGPKNDPAGIKGTKALEAFKKISETKADFISRGDDSGTHKKEFTLWKETKIKPSGNWYIQSGAGMETTLRIANEKKAYCFVDRATWLAHTKEMDVIVKLVEGDVLLYNPYSVIAVSPNKFPWANYKLANKFVEFVRSSEGQKIIKDFGVGKFGEPLFYPDVVKF